MGFAVHRRTIVGAATRDVGDHELVVLQVEVVAHVDSSP